MDRASIAISSLRRDAALRRLRTANRVVASAAIGLTALFTGLAAKAFPGHAHRVLARGHTAHHDRSAPASASGRSAGGPSLAHGASRHRLKPPAQPPTVAPTPAAAAPVTPAPVVSGGS
jgi:hypothetical protein